MIAAVPKNLPATTGAVVPGVLALLGRDFASLLPAAKDDAHPAGDRQAKAETGKDLPDCDTPAVAPVLPIVIQLPSPVSQTSLPPSSAGSAIAILSPAPNANIATVDRLPLSGPADVGTPTAANSAIEAPVVAPPAAGQVDPNRAVSDLPLIIAAKPAARTATPLAVAGNDLPRAGPTDPQTPAKPLTVIVTQQAIAVMADRPPPLVQGLIATVRATTDRPTSPAIERAPVAEPRSDTLTALPVAAASIETHPNMLDLRQEHWPQRMVDHIATLRDAADANDTRIRLVPDALGTIDVHLRHEGETVHVGFIADRVETRALLDQAQPKLTELGEARGLRFAHSGTGHSGQHAPRHAHEPHLPTAPSHAIAETETADDIDAARLA